MTKSARNMSVEELEVKVAFMEDALSKLSDEFYLQQKELEKLKAQYASLISKVRTISDSEGDAGEILDERPPHY